MSQLANRRRPTGLGEDDSKTGRRRELRDSRSRSHRRPVTADEYRTRSRSPRHRRERARRDSRDDPHDNDDGDDDDDDDDDDLDFRSAHRSRDRNLKGTHPDPAKAPSSGSSRHVPTKSVADMSASASPDNTGGVDRRKDGQSSSHAHQHSSRRDNRDRTRNRTHDRERERERERHHHHSSAQSQHDLPFHARNLSRHDLDTFAPLFSQYLDIQKQLDMSRLDRDEVRGRWKSFVGKWNRGELAEGWYDPEMFSRYVEMQTFGEAAAAQDSATTGQGRRENMSADHNARAQRSKADYDYSEDVEAREKKQVASPPMSGHGVGGGGAGLSGTTSEQDGDDDDDYAPPLPPDPLSAAHQGDKKGPGIPTMQDLALSREADEASRQGRIDELRLARKADRAEQRERLDELAPRAEPGTRERQLEKKRALNEKLGALREGSAAGGDMAEVGEADLMGGGDGIEDYRRRLASQQRKKTERELRREAVARARAAEREERLRAYRAREEEKMARLKELAKARFG